MLRFIVMVIRSIWYMPWAMIKCVHMNKHPEKYDELAKYRHVQNIVNFLRKRSRTETLVYGEENLPENGPYIMFANHQGKYDGLSVVCFHDKPMTIIMEKKKADMIVARWMMPLVQGRALDLHDPRQQIETLKAVTEDLKRGRRYLIFPEGGYENNKNAMREWHTGVFKCAYDSHCTVVPVVLIDAYKAMNGNSLKKVTTQTHYLPPIYYEEYKDMKRGAFCELVKGRIQEKLDEILGKSEEETVS